MKKLAITGVTATALSVMVSPLAFASGWIVVDPITPGIVPHHIVVPPPGHVRPPHGIIVPPGGDTAPPPPGHTLLKGGVSFGLHLQQEQVKVDINGPVARTYITQVFSNDSDSNLAGTYLFPLPEDTTFSSFSLQIDGKPVEGQILEAQEARTQYETIVRQMVDPGLLEYADYKTVRARIFPIPAHGTKKLELEYTQALKAENGLYKYRFPLKAEEGADPADDVKIDVKLASQKGLRTIWSPTHTINSKRDGDHKATITYEDKDVLPDKDFFLYYSVSDKDMAADLMAQKRADDNGYFLLSVAPPVEAKAIDKKDIILVADTSGSMAGDKMEECKKALKYVINALNPGDRFGVVQFNTDVEPFRSQMMEATNENKKAALGFVDELEARGGTNIGEAIKTATNLLGDDKSRAAYIVLMTDGEPTVGECSPEKLLQMAGSARDIRLFDFGVGYDVNTKLLNQLAEQHHGVSQYVEPNENLETALSGFYQKIKSPILSDVKIAYDGIEVKDVYPKEVKDIFAGTQVMLIGRYKNGGDARVKITGKLDGQTKEFAFPVKFPSEESGHSYLNRLWAMRRIGYLTDVAQSNGNTKEVIDEIVSLSKKYGIITQYTSFLVTDPSTETLGWAHRQTAMMPGVAGDASRTFATMPAAGAPAPMARSWGAGGGASKKRGSAHHSELAALPPPSALPPPPLPAGIGGVEGPRDTNMFQVEPTVVDERHYTAGRSDGAVRGRLMHGSMGVAGSAGAPASLSKAAFYSAPRATQIVDARPVVRDFRDAPSTGKDAVVAAKSISGLQQSSALDDKTPGGVKSVEDKTFYFVRGFWTDSDFDESKQKPEIVEFGSKRYFDLIASDPELRKYFSAGTQIVVVHKGHCYKVVQPASATG